MATTLDKPRYGTNQMMMVQALDKMIGLVESGQWCRDKISTAGMSKRYELTGEYCALGLVGVAVSDNPYNFHNLLGEKLIALLDKSIDVLPEGRAGERVNGGTIRGRESKNARVATYNNTRFSERDILTWFRRAKDKLLGS